MKADDYLEVNRKNWDSKVEAHVQSEFYNLKGFKDGENALNDIELELLGNVQGKSILHLQCHFGMDTLSLARMGAEVTGIDFSPIAISKAKELSKELEIFGEFVCADVYSTPEIIAKQFDIVFTSYGTIGWLPDVNTWASVIAQMLKPNGRFIMVDFHPTLWMMDEDFHGLQYSYFNVAPIVEFTSGSYAARDIPTKMQSIGWNHSFGDILGGLMQQNLEINHFQEYDYSPYPCFKNLVKIGYRKYQVEHLIGKLPMVYSIAACKK